MYWKNGENMGNHDYSKINVPIVPMKNYIFLERKEASSFQQYIVFHVYYGDIHLAVIMISPFFPSTLVPFMHVWNHLSFDAYTDLCDILLEERVEKKTCQKAWCRGLIHCVL